ncbi:MAG TPA: TetR/AcrR family transcriptional regulator [Gammaproteobacteria bacterium]
MTKTRSPATPVSRDKVLATALDLFTRKGYFNTSMRDITRESGVSTGSVYHHFRDKEGVALALYQSLIARMRCELEQIMACHDSAHDQCRAVVELLFRITEQEPAVMSFMLYVKHREFLPEERPVCSSEPFELMRTMVHRGMERGEIERRDLLVASSCLFGGAIRMVTARLDGLAEQPLEHYLDEIWACSWRSVAAPGQ